MPKWINKCKKDKKANLTLTRFSEEGQSNLSATGYQTLPPPYTYYYTSTYLLVKKHKKLCKASIGIQFVLFH